LAVFLVVDPFWVQNIMRIDEAKIKSAFSTRVRKCVRPVFGILVLYGIFGFFVLPPIAKNLAQDCLSETLHRPVAIGRMRINPFTFSLVIERLEVKEREGEKAFAALDELYLGWRPVSLWRQGLVIDEIRLLNPRLHIVRQTEKRYNFPDWAGAKTKNEKPVFSLNNIQVSGGRIEFDDHVTGEKHLVSDLALKLPFVSNMAYATDIFVEPHFSAILDGAPIELKGQSKPFSESRKSEFKLVLRHAPLSKFFAYFPTGMPVRIESGALDTDLALVFDLVQAEIPRMTLSGTASIRDLKMIRPDGALLLAFAQLDLALLAAEPFGAQFRIKELALDSPEIVVRADRTGKIEWADFLLKAKDASKTSLDWSLGEGKIRGGRLRWNDASFARSTTIEFETIEAFVKNLDSKGGTADFGVAFTQAKGGVNIDGTFGLAPFEADFSVSARTLDLLPLRPYFSGKLNLDVTRGHVSANGQARLRERAPGEGMTGGFSGEFTMGNFQSLDKARADFLRWKSLHADRIEAHFGPDSITIGEIALSDFFARLVVNPDGRINLLDIVRQDEKAAPPPKNTPPIRIDKITLQGGRVRFTDNFIKPNYTASLEEIGGRVTGLSSVPESRASLELRGNYDRVAPLRIQARINPLSEQPYLDLQADVKGIDLTALSAYSSKYAGYAIDKGKLSLSVKYKIENRQLEAENRVFLDQLTFGEAVESKDATTLPVRLAVSLLKNREGEIDINLPISGSLDDPQFSVGGLVVKMLVNLLTKAAISPFALIGAMLGNGEEVDNVTFDPGRSALTQESIERLESLARALSDRPALKFEIEGRAEPDQDMEGIKRARLERKIRAEKLGRTEPEDEDPSLSGIGEQEYPGLLERVYAAENFPKPRNVIGFVKSLPVEEMEKLILANSVVDENDLRALANRRARTVRDWLVLHGVAAERIFLLPGKIGVAEEGSSARGASFSLK
jgi:hypothetical protein